MVFKKMRFKKLIGQVHLWLGLASGLIVVVVGLTGCIYVFQIEISSVTDPWRAIPDSPSAAKLSPSQLKAIAEKQLPGKTVKYVGYEKNKASFVGLFGKDYSLGLFIHPYTGQVLKTRNFKKGDDFFSFVLHGHRALWLPYETGRPIIGYAILVFVLMLITGLILWWPKKWNKHNRKKSFTVGWKASFKRVNYDLHNVLGFYTMVMLFVIALTGLVWSFAWVSKSIYWLSSAGKAQPKFERPLSDTTISTASAIHQPTDTLWRRFTQQKPAVLLLFFPDNKAASVQANINSQQDKNHGIQIFYFDQYSLRPLKGGGVYAKPYREAGIADQISRLNYDIHTGQVGGLPTKILAFIASLVAASLPVTGFIIWWGKKKKQKKKRPVMIPIRQSS